MKRCIQNVGGLGNQLFIWNAAHSLAKLSSSKVVIFSPRNSNRKNELLVLKHFCNHEIYIKETEVLFFILRCLDRAGYRIPILRSVYNYFGLKTIDDSTSKLEYSRKSYFYRGYFQNVDMVIQNPLGAVDEIKMATLHQLKELSNRVKLPDQYEAFHIRRGDFLENSQILGVLADEYYEKLRGSLPLVLSTERANELTNDMKAHYVSTSEVDSSWASFALLSGADRLIAANSTFSWWAGLILKTRLPTGEVIQPARYFKSSDDSSYLRHEEFAQAEAEYL